MNPIIIPLIGIGLLILGAFFTTLLSLALASARYQDEAAIIKARLPWYWVKAAWIMAIGVLFIAAYLLVYDFPFDCFDCVKSRQHLSGDNNS